ncbi:DUF4307 domain-containing protein [Nocardioides marmorisolisilvae]|uniref:DUF4307 domain-containing protein n=1 Tax=Nocardioides marmorisolisilvae TaxID=1542737 RepID=A0A3N0DZ63_9ACTN|nr:DUF4307 domain-containing protein [Nocardioides marmorisolisilvae]RNL80890.1 DUF4307 domain-containing protein [Nocardioides marmorisolisilvae]
MSDLLAERYGKPSPRRRAVIVGATTLLAIVFLTWLGWVAIFHGDPAIDSQVSSFNPVSAHQIDVKLDTRFRNDHVTGNCLVRATAADHSIVGELNLSAKQIRAAEGHWIPIRTERRATTAEVIRCTGS